MKNTDIKPLQHVALIMDGNRRWAKQKGYPPFQGHKKGEERILPIIDQAIKLKIPYLTFWAFSTENWYRSKQEVSFLLQFFSLCLERKIDDYHRKNVKLNLIGDLSRFPSDLQKKMLRWVEITKDNKKITVNIALNYGGRDEIIRAINKLMKNVSITQCSKAKITKEIFEQYLDTVGQPDPDLMIRTGGEERLSGFLPWQLEYAELYFTDIFWPDFIPQEFQKAVENYYQRKRRFGK